jgi:glycosyltransferase involved in cell wall biosynthesis
MHFLSEVNAPLSIDAVALMDRTSISVIIPARNRADDLAVCLQALCTSQPSPHEMIVVDDASTDNTADVAQRFGAIVIRLETNHDSNFCRNRGAEAATGDILLFLDSDVVVQPDTLRIVLDSFSNNSTAAIVGLYSAHHRHRSIASQYKNLWIRYSYLRSGHELDWIFGAVTAIRKEDFWKAGGFDKTLFMKHGGEDLEFGKRMSNSEYHIRLNPHVEVEHLKRYTLSSLLRNDYHRSQGFILLAGNIGQLGRSLTRGFVNVYPNFAHSVPLIWLVVLSLIAGFWIPAVWWFSALSGALYLALNASFLRFYGRHRGWTETVAVFGILVVDHLVCGVGVITGLFKWLSSR